MVSGLSQRVYSPGAKPKQPLGYYPPAVDNKGNIIRTGGTVGGSGGQRLGKYPPVSEERLKEIAEENRQAEAQKQAQAEKQRQAEAQKQATRSTIQQAVVTDRRPTLSSGGTPVRNVEFGNKYAEYERRLNEEARLKGRNLGIGEREKIAGEVYNQPVQTQEQKVIVAKEGKVSLPIDTNTKYYPGVTIKSNKDVTRQGTAYTTPKLEIPVYPPGTIYNVQTGSFKVPGLNKYIPTTKTYTIGKDYTSREATTEEQNLLRQSQVQELFTETAKQKAPSRIQFELSEAKGRYKNFASEEVLDPEKTRTLFAKAGKPGEFVGGVVYGTIGTKGALIRTGVIIGVSAGAGFVIQGATAGATYGATRLFGATAGAVTGTTLKVGTIGAGVYYGGTYIKSNINSIYNASTYFEKGQITGRAGLDIGATIYGFRAGAKGFDFVQGLVRTRGRTFIDIPQGEYPTAPVRTQLELFRKNVYTELGEKPGAFHTTGDTFWKGGRITPELGTSELPGLYGSTKISTPFTRIPGSSSTSKFDLSKLFKNLFTPPGKPGIAYLQPEGFRYSPARVGKWYSPARKGYADVPGIKTEIEAIFRPESGSYLISLKKYYAKIKGVRVPIDSFVYDKTISTQGRLNLVGGQSSYSKYASPSYSNPTAAITLVSTSTTSTSMPSLVSVTPYSSASSSMPSMSSIVSSSKPSSSRGSSGRSSRSYSSAVSSIVPSSSIMSSSKASSKISSKTSLSKLYSSIAPSSRRYNKYSYGYPKEKMINYKFKSFKMPKQPSGRFPVFVRRFGKWKNIGFGSTPSEAIFKGKEYSQRTLGRSFYIGGRQPSQILPGFRTKKEKVGQIFIQKTKYPGGSTLGSRGEKSEIQLFRNLKKQFMPIRIKKRKKKGGIFYF